MGHQRAESWIRIKIRKQQTGKMKKNNLSLTVEQLQKTGAKYAALFLLGALTACGGEQAMDMPAQKWKDVDVRVEVRPSPPRAGMSEFLVLTTGERGRPVYDLIVSLRTDDQDEWKQAIQDGQVGVFRRAVDVESGARSVLQVQIKRKDEEGVLRFPLGI
jgi:hypothetical protein